jgi:hypothetical protein
VHRFVRVIAPLTLLAFVILTSSDAAALVFAALHLPPNLAVAAFLVLGTLLLARRTLRRFGRHIGRVRGLTAGATLLLGVMVYPSTAVIWPLWTWLRLNSHIS